MNSRIIYPTDDGVAIIVPAATVDEIKAAMPQGETP
jgi:hypothetical protein